MTSISTQPPQRQSSPVLIWGFALVAGAIALAMTNPGKAAYVDYAAKELAAELKQDCNLLAEDIRVAGLLDLPMQSLCRSLIHGADLLGRGGSKYIIDRSTKEQDFVLFSLYTTEVMGQRFQSIGIARQFLTW